MAKRTPQEAAANKQRDRLIEKTYYAHGQGVEIRILDIPEIFKRGRAALDTGADLEAAIKAAIADLRQN